MTQGARNSAAAAAGEDFSPGRPARVRRPQAFPAQGDIFHDEQAARRHLEALRWPGGVNCPHCQGGDRVRALRGRSGSAGLHFCVSCRRKFTVRIGTVCERSHVPLHKWLLAAHLMAGAEQRPSVNLVSRIVGIQYRSAAFMAERIRHAACLGSTTTFETPIGAAPLSTDATADRRRDEILRRLLRMPYRPHSARPSVIADELAAPAVRAAAR